MTTISSERNGFTPQDDPTIGIEIHINLIDRLRGPLSFELVMELLEKTFFTKEKLASKYQPRLVFVYLKNNPELQLSIKQLLRQKPDLLVLLQTAAPTLIQYIQKIIPYIVEPHDQKLVSEEYATKLTEYPQQISNYLKRVPLVV